MTYDWRLDIMPMWQKSLEVIQFSYNIFLSLFIKIFPAKSLLPVLDIIKCNLQTKVGHQPVQMMWWDSSISQLVFYSRTSRKKIERVSLPLF